MPLVTINGVNVYIPDGYRYVTHYGMAPTLEPIPGWKPGDATPNAATTGTIPTVNPNPVPTAPLTKNQLAWQNAMNAYNAQKQDLMNQYGLTAEGKVDPNNQYGLVRQTLAKYGQQLELARLANQGRGLGTHGVVNRSDRLIRYLLNASTVSQSRNFLNSMATIEANIGKLGPKPVF